MSKVYVLIGKIASGKTTWAKQKCEEERAIILSHDDLMLELEDACEGRAAHVERACRISKYFASLCKDLVSIDVSLILDYGFWTKNERDLMGEELAKRNIPFEFLYITCDEELRLSRLAERNARLAESDKREYIIPTPLRERLDSFFEEPTNDEEYTLVSVD